MGIPDWLVELQQRQQAQQGMLVQQMGLGALGGTGIAPMPSYQPIPYPEDNYEPVAVTPEEYAKSLGVSARETAERNKREMFNGAFASDYGKEYYFNRINERTCISAVDLENESFKEPLDELRIKVARWLNN